MKKTTGTRLNETYFQGGRIQSKNRKGKLLWYSNYSRCVRERKREGNQACIPTKNNSDLEFPEFFQANVKIMYGRLKPWRHIRLVAIAQRSASLNKQ